MNTPATLRQQMSNQDFLAFGLEDVAYVKRIDGEEDATYGIFAADGTRMAEMASEEVALATIRQHDLQPHRLH